MTGRCGRWFSRPRAGSRGAGIAAADLGRIFGRFSRIDAGRSREVGGFGLGLAVVKAIAEAHHGSVQVRSTPGRGSVFELQLSPTTTTAAAVSRVPADRRPVPR
ncbi:MAG TPA: ATP-binding protein [Streptosporangiaceae bacterium]|nr:ATP-binding protein [Streptosporangiaceae bacterium]